MAADWCPLNPLLADISQPLTFQFIEILSWQKKHSCQIRCWLNWLSPSSALDPMAWWNIYLSIIYRTLSIDIQKLDKRILRTVLGPGSWRLLTNYSYDVTNLLVSIFTIVGFVPVLVWPGHCWQRADTSYGGLLITLKHSITHPALVLTTENDQSKVGFNIFHMSIKICKLCKVTFCFSGFIAL